MGRDIERLLAGEPGMVVDEASPPGAEPVFRSRSRWPWHVAVTSVFVVGIGTAALLARGGGKPSAAALPPAPVLGPTPKPRAVALVPAPVAKADLVTPPTPPSTSLLEPIRRTGKLHAGHATLAPAASAPAAPTAATKKSKADDKVAPSPYTSPQAP